MFRTEFLHFLAIDWGEKRVSHNVVVSEVQFRSLELQLYFSGIRGMSPLGAEHRQLKGKGGREEDREEGREGGREAYRKGGRKERTEGGRYAGREEGREEELVKETCMAQLSEAAFLLQVYLCPFHTNSLGKLSCCTFIKFGNSLVK